VTKILLSTDWHLREESADVVIPGLYTFLQTAVDHAVDGVAILGDVYEHRYHVRVSLQNALNDWVLEARKHLQKVIFLPGNHDQDDVSGRNALEVFHGPAVVHTNPAWDECGLWLPFRKDTTQIVDFIQANPRPAWAPNRAFLHHGIAGAYMNDHVKASPRDGIDLSVFSGFDHVYAGHWHRHHDIGNVTYVGSPWQTTAAEAGHAKGFLLLGDGDDKFIPMDFGPRHFRVDLGGGANVGSLPLRAGDVVHAKAGTGEAVSDEVTKALADKGVTVILSAPKVEYGGDRLGLGPFATAEEVAIAYAKSHGKDPDKLLAVFRELTE